MEPEDSKEHLNTECAYIIEDAADESLDKEEIDDGMATIITTQECSQLAYVHIPLSILHHLQRLPFEYDFPTHQAATQ